MKIAADWLHAPGPRSVMEMLGRAGHEAYFVGGCVRNALLGAAISDIDIATAAHPDQIRAAARACGLKSVPTGADHGTITVVADGTGYEVTTFRRDVETDGRRAVVAFAETLEEDARRRDFTMNALYARADGTLVDPLGGLADLRARRIRFIEDPARRIAEDYLRILRFFRFHAWYGARDEGLDPQALSAIAAAGDGIDTLSRERIGAEMARLLSAPDPVTATAAMERAGILARVLPGASSTLLGPVVLMETDFGLRPDWRRRLAALGGQDLPARLRLSRADARRLQDYDSALSLPLAEAAYRHGPEVAWDVALVRAAASQQPPPADLPRQIARAATARFPVTAGDLPDLSGRALGQRLRALETDWIASGFCLSRDALLDQP